MEKKYYTAERNVQIVISLLKAHGVKIIVVSPGTTNITLVGSLMHDDFFELYSCVDERSAAYMACGIAAEVGKPVALSCTGATASRNYISGMTEAFYRKLPVIAITSHQGNHRLGHLFPQNIDRRTIQKDIALLSITIPTVKDKTDERYCEIEVNRALLETKRNGGGPVHINLATTYCNDFSIRNLPPAKVIHRHFSYSQMPTLKADDGHIVVFIGSHRKFTHDETKIIDNFCATYDAVVFCDHTSGYHGNYEFHQSLVLRQSGCESEIYTISTLIHIGEVSGDYCGAILHPKRVWRVSEDGELRDTFGMLTDVFQMREVDFFLHYSQTNVTNSDFLQMCINEYKNIFDKIPSLPFSNLWIAKQISPLIPKGSELFLGILNTLRTWNYFTTANNVICNSNVGGFGIDGCMSTMIGASLMNSEKLFFGIFGDLSFFYDLNVLGNRSIQNNLRIMLINNGRGTEFRNYDHPGSSFGDEADNFIAAAGHFGNKSRNLVRHYAEDLGFLYLSASSKDEFLKVQNIFLDSTVGSQSIIMECFTDMKDESDALYAIHHIIEAPHKDSTTMQKLKTKIAAAIGDNGVKVVKRILK